MTDDAVEIDRHVWDTLVCVPPLLSFKLQLPRQALSYFLRVYVLAERIVSNMSFTK